MKKFSTFSTNSNQSINPLHNLNVTDGSIGHRVSRDSKYSLSGFNHQTGMALIMVLVIVLLLAVAGTIAIRSSKISLQMTTSAQVEQLLFQSSDVPLTQLDNVDVATFDAMTQLNGPIGYLSTKAQRSSRFSDVEYVLCYQPTQRMQLYAGANKHRIVGSADGKTTYQSRLGYCQLDNAESYTSARKVVATQVAMTRPTMTASVEDDVNVRTATVKASDNSDITIKRRTHTTQPLQGTIGTDMGSLGGTDGVNTDVYMRAYVTSVLPALALSASVDDIDECMQLPIGGLAENSATTNQMNCLNATGAPYSVQVQDYLYTKDAVIK